MIRGRQGKSDFRRDCRTATADHLNVDGMLDLDRASDLGSALKAAIRELLRHRYADPEAAARIAEHGDAGRGRLLSGGQASRISRISRPGL